MPRVRLGLENLLSAKEPFGEARVGLIAHPASVDSQLRHAADLFAERSDIELAALFGPQHGIRGETQDNMIEWEGFSDPATGLPVYSLYGEHRKPSPEMMEGLDALVFDVQDVGTRVYTFIYTMALAMEACAETGRKMYVLDRPNPIGGRHVEGGLLDTRFKSFVGLYPLPMRHGMTVGELAKMFNEAFGIGCDLTVAPMTGWRREMRFDETELPWVMPSPNMPTLETATVYPGTVLFEGTNVSEGRGTTRPFELIGAPWIDARRLAESMERRNHPGARFRPAHFQPTFHKGAGEICGGVQVHVTNADVFRPYAAGLMLLEEIYRQDPEKFAWKQPPYEYEYEKLPIDCILGTDAVRLALEADEPLRHVMDSWKKEEGAFLKQRRKYLLYNDPIPEG